MKKTLFCCSIVLAILLPKKFYAAEAIHNPGFNVAHHEYNSVHDQVTIENSFFEDSSDDDDINDPERKRYSPERTCYSNATVLAANFSGNHLKRLSSPEFLFYRQAFLYLFTKAFRL